MFNAKMCIIQNFTAMEMLNELVLQDDMPWKIANQIFMSLSEANC